MRGRRPAAGSPRLGHLGLCSAASAPVSSATHPGAPSEPSHVWLAGYSQVPHLHSTPSHPSLMGAPAFPGTTSWFDTARRLTTLTTASRLTLAPLTWMWPCSIEMLVEVGAWAREEGCRGSLPRSPFFCPRWEQQLPGLGQAPPRSQLQEAPTHPALGLLATSQSCSCPLLQACLTLPEPPSRPPHSSPPPATAVCSS